MGENPPPHVIEDTFGPMVTGTMIQQLFLGILCAQVFNYYREFRNDAIFYKALVAVLFVLNLIQGVIDFYVLYRTAVENFGDYDSFDLQGWPLWAEPAITAIIGFVAQGFFMERCFKSTKSWATQLVLFLLVLISLGSGLAVSVSCSQAQRFSKLILIPIPITFWLISTSVTDVAIAGVLVGILIRSKTPFRKTEAVISRIIRLSMETSATTAFVALLNVVLFLAIPHTAYHLLPQYIMCRVYAHTVMVTLSSRTALRNVLQGTVHSSFGTSKRGKTAKTNPTDLNIQVTTTVQNDLELSSTGGPHLDDDEGSWKEELNKSSDFS